MSDDPAKPTGLINNLLQNDDGIVSQQRQRKLPDDAGPYRWLQQAPIYCDYYTAQTFADGSIIRIAFAEYISRDYYPIYRAAVAMPVSDVKSLVRTLRTLIDQAEKEADEALAAKAAPPDEE